MANLCINYVIDLHPRERSQQYTFQLTCFTALLLNVSLRYMTVHTL